MDSKEQALRQALADIEDRREDRVRIERVLEVARAKELAAKLRVSALEQQIKRGSLQ